MTTLQKHDLVSVTDVCTGVTFIEHKHFDTKRAAEQLDSFRAESCRQV